MIRRILFTVSYGAGAVILFLAMLSLAAFLTLQTDTGKKWLILKGSSILKGIGIEEVSLGRIDGVLPFALHIDSLAIKIRGGDDLITAEEIYLRWRPSALLKGRIHITELYAARITIPENLTRQEKPIKEASGPGTWLGILGRLVLKDLRIERISLPKGILGSAQDFQLFVSTAQLPEGAEILLKASGGLGTYLSASIAIRHDDDKIAVSATGWDPAGGAMSQLIGMSGPLGFSLQGEGPFSEWKGRLKLEGGDGISLSLDLEFERKNGLSLKGEGDVFALRIPAALKAVSDYLEESNCPQSRQESQSEISRSEKGSEKHFNHCLLKTHTAFSLSYLPENNGLNIESLLLQSDLFRVYLSGKLLLRGLYFKGNYSVNLACPRPFVGISCTGPFHMHGQIEGPLPAFSIKGDIEIKGIASESFKISSFEASFLFDLSKLTLSGSGELRDLVLTGVKELTEPRLLWEARDIAFSKDEVQVSRLIFKSSYGDAELSGRISPSMESYTADGIMILSDTKRLSKFFGITLPLSVKNAFNISGDILKGTATGEVKGSAIIDRVFLSKEIPAALFGPLAEEILFRAYIQLDSSKDMKIVSAEIQNKTARLSGSGAVTLKEASISSSWILDLPDITGIFPQLKGFSAGALRAEGTLSGHLSCPVLNAALVMDRLRAKLFLKRISDLLTGHLLINGELRGLDIDFNSSLEAVGGVLKFQKIAFKACDIDVRGDISIDTKDMTLTGKIHAKTDGAACRGRSKGIKGSGRVEALLERGAKGQEIDMTFTGKDVSLKGYSVSSVRGRAHLSNAFIKPVIKAEGILKGFTLGRLSFPSIDLSLEWEEASKKLTLIKADAVYEDISFKLINSMVLRADSDEITLEDTEIGIGDPEKFDSSPYRGLRLHLGAVSKANRLRASLRLEGLEQKPVTATADIPIVLTIYPFSLHIPEDGSINGDVSAEIDLVKLAPSLHLRENDLGGQLFCAVSLGGSFTNPSIQGHLRMQDGTFSFRRLGLLLRDITLEAALSEGTIEILRAEARDVKDGRFAVSGSARIFPQKEASFDINIFLERFLIINRDDIRTEASGNARFRGNAGSPILTGRLIVWPGDLRLPRQLPPDLVELEVIEIPAPLTPIAQKSGISYGYLNDISLDLIVESPGRIFLRGRGLESEWEGNIHLTGSAGSPNISGRFSIVRGRFNLFGRRFDLKNGTVILDGYSASSAHLNALAEAKTSDLTARLDVAGSLANPVFTLSSDPSMPSDEILARLLFGRDLSKITPIQALSLADAAMTLAGKGEGLDIMGRARKLLGVDNIEVNMSDTDTRYPTIGIGKYLGEKVFLQVERGVHPKSSKASVEVEITPELSLESEVGADSEGGIGVIWRWDY